MRLKNLHNTNTDLVKFFNHLLSSISKPGNFQVCGSITSFSLRFVSRCWACREPGTIHKLCSTKLRTRAGCSGVDVDSLNIVQIRWQRSVIGGSALYLSPFTTLRPPREDPRDGRPSIFQFDLFQFIQSPFSDHSSHRGVGLLAFPRAFFWY